MFKNLFKKKQSSQLISVVEYQDYYVFETFYKIETGLWKRTDIISVENKAVENLRIGQLILAHLEHSKTVKESNFNFKLMYDNYKKETKLSSIKKQMQHSKNVQILKVGDKISFTPTKNGGVIGENRGYSEITDKGIKTNVDDEYQLADYLKQSFLNCE